MNKTLHFKFGFNNLLFCDNKIWHHIVINFLEKHELVFEIADNEHLNEYNIDDNLEYEETWAYNDDISL